MIEFYKKNWNYLYEHAVDPDKRRYAIKGEAIRHYIDVDHWGNNALEYLPVKYEEAITKTSAFYYINELDTLLIFDTLNDLFEKNTELTYSESFRSKFTTYTSGILIKDIANWIHDNALFEQDDQNWIIQGRKILFFNKDLKSSNASILIDDRFSKHGILPYSLPQFYYRLVEAFKERNEVKILKLSSDLGHYIGDAHVPLHTSMNYNGQLTNQDGIHAFWESRLPELFAETKYNFVVGSAEYIPDIQSFTRKIIKKSHSLVDSVLLIEKRLSKQFPESEQYCFETRLGQIVKLPCKAYAELYDTKLDNQVEEQFRSCILAIGSVWMSAWNDAGQPMLNELPKSSQYKEFEAKDSFKLKNTSIEIRSHE